MRSQGLTIALVLVVLWLVTGCGAGGKVELMHVHGLGYTADGKQLVIPAHHGLRIYESGQWRDPGLPSHDYMGYVATDDGFYSSGHPGTREFRNPLGLVRSTDGGNSMQVLAFEGESDFHIMGVGYYSHAIYVHSPVANSRLVPGVHFSLDDGKTWQRSDRKGHTGSLDQIAVHPTDPQVVALAGADGLFLSRDHGHTFVPITPSGRRVTAASFAPDGGRIFYGFQTLHAYDLAGGQITDLQMPGFDREDGIGYLTASPTRPGELALATFQRSVFLSEDGGQSWREIAHKGMGK